MNIAVLYYPLGSTNTKLELQKIDGRELNDTILTLPVRLGKALKNEDKSERYLRLVISEKGQEIAVKYGVSLFTNFELAKKNLALTSFCKVSELGFVNLKSSESYSRVAGIADRVKAWASQNHFDAVIWAEGTEDPAVIGHELELVKNYYINKDVKDYLRQIPTPLSEINQTILASDTPPSPSIPMCRII